MSTEKSYVNIFKASSIVGGAAGITMLLSMVRIKFAAILIGSSGVGLIASFTTIQGLLSTVAGLGIQSSAVREIALAVAKDDKQAIGRAVLTLRRVSLLAGLGGMFATIALSSLLSRLTFNSENYSLDIAALGIIILLTNLTGGHLAIIQGMRRIGDMARANIVGALFSALSAITFYWILGLRGVVPSLVTIAAIQFVITWYYVRRVPMEKVILNWMQTFYQANGMIKLGLVFMWNGLMLSAVSYFTIVIISREIGVHAVGLYSAAFALSGMFINFVLGAMGADYYPRLTAVANDNHAINQLVNEQTEIGILISLPGLCATLVLAPWLIQAFYSHEFIAAVNLLQWFVLGCLGRVISWPLGYVILALGKGRWYLLTETMLNLAHFILVAIGLMWFGIEGVAIAFSVLYIIYIVIVYVVCRHLTLFSWSPECRNILLRALPITIIIFIFSRSLTTIQFSIIGVVITFIASVYCLRELINRLGKEHKVVKAIRRLPGATLLIINKN